MAETAEKLPLRLGHVRALVKELKYHDNYRVFIRSGRIVVRCEATARHCRSELESGQILAKKLAERLSGLQVPKAVEIDGRKGIYAQIWIEIELVAEETA